MTKLTPAGQAVESELLGLLKATVEPWVYNAIASAAIEAAKQSGQVVERDCAHDRPFCCEERAKAYGKPTPPTGPASPTEEEREHCERVSATIRFHQNSENRVFNAELFIRERAAARAEGYERGHRAAQSEIHGDALQAKLNDLLESAERTTKHAKSNGMEDWPVFKKLRAAIERART